MAAGTYPDAWHEVALVTVLPAGGTARHFHTLGTDIKMDNPDYPFKSVANIGGGRLGMSEPQEDGEFTLDLYPIHAGDGGASDSIVGSFDMYMAGGTIDTTQPLKTNSAYTAGISKQRETYCVAVMLTDDTAVSSALGVTSTSGKVAYRWYCKLARITGCKDTYNPTDGLKSVVTFKFPAMNKAGTIRPFRKESTNDCNVAPLAAITYSSSTDTAELANQT